VFIAVDYPVVRAWLQALVDAEEDMVTVGEAGDGEAAVRDAPAAWPNVVVLDVPRPGSGVMAAADAVARACPGVKLLVLSAHETPAYVRQMFAAGAAGYALTRSAADDLARAVRVVAAGGTYLDSRLAGELVRPGTEGMAEPVPELSDREAEVVKLLARGYSLKEVAAKLAISVRTVETYRARSLEKLGVRTRAALVRFAYERGWLNW
jgi:DNA-binding NarL/FixJ family response regulator